MHSVPIHRGVNRPQGRPRHALLPFLARLAAIAGFAFAGWLVLSALTHSAFAAERAEQTDRPAAAPDAPGHGAPGHGAPDVTPGRVRNVESPIGAVSGAVRGAVPGAVSGGVGEIGGHPVRYLRARQQDVLDGKDRAVRHVVNVVDEAGAPQVGGLLQGHPVLAGIVDPATERQPLLHGGLPSDAQQAPEAQPGPEAAQPDAEQARDKAAHAAKAHARYARVPLTATAGVPAQERADLCPDCGGDHRSPSPDPALPSGPDGSRGGGSPGGHQFAPVADLLNNRYPAAPSAADTGTFRRTALSDVAAPGGPSIVPD
ncbi:hypothetical protein [Actinomadura sp. K4S16]|uniref:hypothetical protein n=1 Tax=Actinomadura sp. K4S16 TaxID=1316147 RepID=UPI0011EE6E1E|nr:hypothetical protein [Actinomadura sp. K4S16]